MSAHWTELVTIICGVLSMCNARKLSPLEIAIRSNLPEGQSFKFFLEICEACGEMYGSATAHFCLIEREQSTYYKCLVAMGFKR